MLNFVKIKKKEGFLITRLKQIHIYFEVLIITAIEVH